MYEQFWDSQPAYYLSTASLALGTPTSMIGAVVNKTGSGRIVRVTWVSLGNSKAAGYVGALQNFIGALYPYTSGGTSTTLKPEDSSHAAPSNTLVDGLTGAVVVGTVIATSIKFTASVSSLEQATAANTARMYGRNLLPHGIGGDVIIRPGEVYGISAGGADATATINALFRIQVATVEPTAMLDRFDTLNTTMGEVRDNLAAIDESVQQLMLQERVTTIVDEETGITVQHQQIGP